MAKRPEKHNWPEGLKHKLTPDNWPWGLTHRLTPEFLAARDMPAESLAARDMAKPLEKRELTPEFLAALHRLWDERGEEILRRVADEHPELVATWMLRFSKGYIEGDK